MSQFKQESIKRILLTVLILSAGLALVPFIDMPARAIGWDLFANVYTPVLEVQETTGAPGSIFYFTGSNYPSHSSATIYINGTPVGTVITDASGTVTFFVNTLGAAVGSYNITLEANINASATQSIELVNVGTLITPPLDAAGLTVYINDVFFLPLIQLN